MIPKKIHYVWVGQQSKPESVLTCIESWKKYFPDHEIIEWNNNTLKDINNQYAEEAFAAKKWAFVSDYLRLYALYHHGGIYLDTDVIITSKFPHAILENDFFMGLEPYKNIQAYPMTAVIGARPYNKIIKGLLNSYDKTSFIKFNGELNLTQNPHRFAQFFLKNFDLKYPYPKDNIIELNKNSKIYPSSYFCTPEVGKKNYSIHLFNGSWLDGYSRKKLLSFFNLKLIRFKRINQNNNTLPLAKNEHILIKINVSNNRFYAITNTSRIN